MPSVTRPESMAPPGGAESTRTRGVGPDTGVAFADLGQLEVGIVQLIEHRRMPFWLVGETGTAATGSSR